MLKMCTFDVISHRHHFGDFSQDSAHKKIIPSLLVSHRKRLLMFRLGFLICSFEDMIKKNL